MKKFEIDLEKICNDILPIIKEDVKGYSKSSREEYYKEFLASFIQDNLYDFYLKDITKEIEKMLEKIFN